MDGGQRILSEKSHVSLLQPKPARRATMSVWGSVKVSGWLLCAATIAGFLARLWWVFQLTTHFRLHLALGLTGLATVWAAKRHWQMSLLCGVCAAANMVLVVLVLSPNPVGALNCFAIKSRHSNA